MSAQAWSAIAAIGAFLSAVVSLVLAIQNYNQNKLTNKRESPNLLVVISPNDSSTPMHWFYNDENGCVAALVAAFINPSKYPVTVRMCYLCVGSNQSVALQNLEVFDLSSLPIRLTSVNGLPIAPANVSFPLTLQPYECIDSYVIFPTFIYTNADAIDVELQVLTPFDEQNKTMSIPNISLANLNNRIADIYNNVHQPQE